MNVGVRVGGGLKDVLRSVYIGVGRGAAHKATCLDNGQMVRKDGEKGTEGI